MIDRARRLGQLGPSERRILFQAWVLFGVVDLALRVLPLPAVTRLASARPRQTMPKTACPERLAQLVEIAGRYAPVEPTCLKAALVLAWILGRRGVATTLRIGVARDAERLRAHAWLERDGTPLPARAGSPDHRPFLPLAGSRSASR